MELIERYLAQVARRLPPARRDDVVTELRSSLHDSLEARTAGGEDRDGVVADLLREYGPPAALADSYLERPRYLVGPELYPAFVKVVVIAIGLVSGLVVFAALAGSVRDGTVDSSSLALGLLSNVLQTAIAVLGWVVIVFWVVERFGRREAREGRDWDPAALPPVNDPDRVSRTAPDAL